MPSIAAVRLRTAIALVVLARAGAVHAQTPQGTAFTYQGRLADAGAPADGTYDFQFRLFDAVTGGTQSGPSVVRDDVPVTAGLFTVALDFGAVFAGSKRFLDIGVRPGASTGAFAGIAPRQELTPVPNAVFSANVPWTGVSSKPAGFADDMDDDVLGALACGGGQVAKWNGSAWACAADANSGGTVTSVATGAGLTGGPVTGAGTLAVASGGITTALLANQAVTSPKIANGAVGLAQINTAQVQARIGGACPAGQYLRAINADGSVACEPVYAPSSIKIVDDPTGQAGQYTSIETGADGLPVISHYESPAGILKLVRCGNLGCTSGNTHVTVDDPANDVGRWSSLAIGADGFPVISYADVTAGALKVAKCSNAACSSSIRTTVDDPPANSVGLYSSIAIGADGLPVISYHDATAGALKVVKCGNDACNNANTFTTVDDPANAVVGTYTSVAIGAGGRPVISYHDATAGALKVARCGNAGCTAGNAITTVDDPADPNTIAGMASSLAIGADGRPVVAYREDVFTTFRLKVAHCGNDACSAGTSLQVVDEPYGLPGDIAIGADGRPVISYYTPATCGLHVAKCGNAGCTAGNLLTSVDGPAGACTEFMGQGSSIAIGSDGLPVISYGHSAGLLKVAKCGTQSCR